MPLQSFFIIVLLLMVVAVLYVELAGMPGEIARERGHPEAKAINLLGWLGLPLGFAPWLIALIWANLSIPGSAERTAGDSQSAVTGAESEQESEPS
jgi:hypothetical protein